MCYYVVRWEIEGGILSDANSQRLMVNISFFIVLWRLGKEAFILGLYNERMKKRLPKCKRRKFLNMAYWKDLQYEFELYFAYCPTQSQLQECIRKLSSEDN
ncbi:hypothetical protein KFK09_005898 [Dendrobium nobile]|uniref:Uncharacterized protein n=1 Tax=Dendrobium nobile TaxID=94219 RepID=A0A8T3C1V1_DENNO|nr:hypothetical protein KFK09_005898 [Dendrobium nobile]